MIDQSKLLPSFRTQVIGKGQRAKRNRISENDLSRLGPAAREKVKSELREVETEAAKAKEKWWQVSWYSPGLQKRVTTPGPIEARTAAAAIAEMKVAIGYDLFKRMGRKLPVNFIAKQVKRNPKQRNAGSAFGGIRWALIAPYSHPDQPSAKFGIKIYRSAPNGKTYLQEAFVFPTLERAQGYAAKKKVTVLDAPPEAYSIAPTKNPLGRRYHLPRIKLPRYAIEVYDQSGAVTDGGARAMSEWLDSKDRKEAIQTAQARVKSGHDVRVIDRTKTRGRVIFEHNDLGWFEKEWNPKNPLTCYRCGKHIKGESKLSADRLPFHPRCYVKAELEAEKELFRPVPKNLYCDICQRGFSSAESYDNHAHSKRESNPPLLWYVQQKRARDDWRTVGKVTGTKKEALQKYEYLTEFGKVRAVTHVQATRDWEAGRAYAPDDWITPFRHASRNPVYTGIDKIAEADLRLAVKEGAILIGGTKVGAVMLEHGPARGRFALVSQDGGKAVNVSGPKAMIKARLIELYDIQENPRHQKQLPEMDRPFLVLGRYAQVMITKHKGSKYAAQLQTLGGGGYYPVNGRPFTHFLSLKAAKKWAHHNITRFNSAAERKRNPPIWADIVGGFIGGVGSALAGTWAKHKLEEKKRKKKTPEEKENPENARKNPARVPNALQVVHWISPAGETLRVFDVVDGAGKRVAMGWPGLVNMTAKRYEQDPNLVAAVERLTGEKVRLFKYTHKGGSSKASGRRNPRKGQRAGGKNLDVFARHQLKIARDTLKLRDEAVAIMGGPSKAEAREIIRRLTGREPRENPTSLDEALSKKLEIKRARFMELLAKAKRDLRAAVERKDLAAVEKAQNDIKEIKTILKRYGVKVNPRGKKAHGLGGKCEFCGGPLYNGKCVRDDDFTDNEIKVIERLRRQGKVPKDIWAVPQANPRGRVWDAYTRNHLAEWLKREMRPGERRAAGQMIRAMVAEYPELIDEAQVSKNRSWREILEMAQRNPKRGSKVQSIGDGFVVTQQGMDPNGNHCVWVTKSGSRARRIQTNGNLPSVHHNRGERITAQGAEEIKDYWRQYIAKRNPKQARAHKPKYKIGEMVYSYENRDYKAPINFIREQPEGYQHVYRLSLRGEGGYPTNSKWINENSLYKIKRKANPNTEPLRKIFKDFHGHDNTGEVFTGVAPAGTPKDLAMLGNLRLIKLVNGRSQAFPRGFAQLGAAQHGPMRRLYIVIKQPLKVPAALQNGAPHNYGEIAQVEYEAFKPHLYGKNSPSYLFYHKLGEEGGRRPQLVLQNGCFLPIQGDYKIEREGIRD